MKLIKYEKDHCGGCVFAGNYMDEQGITYDTVNISHNEEAKQKIIDLGVMQVPVIALEDEEGHILDYVSGFNPIVISKLASKVR